MIFENHSFSNILKISLLSGFHCQLIQGQYSEYINRNSTVSPALFLLIFFTAFNGKLFFYIFVTAVGFVLVAALNAVQYTIHSGV